MSWAALTSGGKDSILAVQKAKDAGMKVSHLVTVVPENTYSYMFHSANLAAVPVMAKRCNAEYVEIKSAGEKEKEIKDMEKGLARIGVEGIIMGAIESEYQRSRIAKVCDRLALKLFAPLWHMDPLTLMYEVSSRLDSFIVVCAADGLGENVLGKKIDENLIDVLLSVQRSRRIHLAGEGGEYESLVLDAPCFSAPVQCSEMIFKYEGLRGEVMIERFW
ncbi:MAG TPA: diphthine--ammonia ligase [Methanocorpusculum sp.]|nr:diphthine--ammonia ligase [Methanocorpusculum sp.]